MLRFAGYKSRMTAIDSPITMRSSLRAIGTTLLALAAFGVAQALPPASEPATAPASRPVTAVTTATAVTAATAVPPVTAVSLKSLLQLRLYDGQLALYTNHPPTIGQITVRLDDPPVTAQLRIISRSQQSSPYRPDAFDLTIEQIGGQGTIHTAISSVGGDVKLWRDTTLPDGSTAVVQLVQPGTPDLELGVIRIYIQEMIGDQETGKANFQAADFSTLIRQHPAPTDQYLRPIFQTLTGQEQLFDVQPALAAEVFAARLRPDAELQRTVAALVSQLDADRPQDRNAAQAALEKLGQHAMIALRDIDTAKLSLEQQTRIRTLLVPHTHPAGVDPAKLRANLHFLLDSLNCPDASSRHAALEELRYQTHQSIVLDVDAPEDLRRANVRQLRRQLTTTPTTAPATTPTTPTTQAAR